MPDVAAADATDDRDIATPELMKAISAAFNSRDVDRIVSHFTDDATVYEHQGWQVVLISGNPENIKITSPDDMVYADFLVKKRLI